LITERFEVGIVICEEWIGRGEANVAAFHEFDAILVVGTVAETHNDVLSEPMGLVQTENAVGFAFTAQD
jgi:hypothetical protein